MHPLAEAIIGGERILAEFERTGKLFFSRFLYLLSSLQDVARHQHEIEGLADRLMKLKTDQWRATLYELLVACSLAHQHDVRLIPEGKKPTPDMVISDPELFFECKARSAPEESVLRFINNYRKQVLGGIIQLSQQIGCGLKILIDIHDESILEQLLLLIERMLRDKITVLKMKEVEVSVVYYNAGPFILPHPMPMQSKELWMWIMGFSEFDKWHYVMPGGVFELDNYSNTMIKSFKRPLLVCIKSTALSSKSANVRNAIKAACKDQLKEHRPGVVQVLINTRFFSLLATPEEILEELQTLAVKLVEEYKSRLAAIYFDVVDGPKFGEAVIGYRQIYASRKTYAPLVDSLPSIILL